jgi:hypothetical protein
MKQDNRQIPEPPDPQPSTVLGVIIGCIIIFGFCWFIMGTCVV